MIEGLKIRIPAIELKNHLVNRAAYHADRAKEKTDALPEFKASLDKMRTGIAPATLAVMNKSTSYHHNPQDTIENIETDIQEHNNKSLMFAFLGDHLFDEDYTLVEADLRRLEIVK